MAKPKPWSVADFERFRLHLTLFARSEVIPLIEDPICRRILIDASIKCGKKDIVEYIAMRDFVHNPKRVHAFVSAWHRTADEEQRDELKQHNLTVFSITSQANVDKFNKWLDGALAEGKEIVIHMDECDHGSGSNQTLSKIWYKIRMSDRITTIMYSATPEEVLYSEEMDDINTEFREGEHVTYTPPEEYCGSERFLREGLVHEAMPFFEEGERYSLSGQGKEIIANLYRNMKTEPSRNIFILRLSGSLSNKKKRMDHFLNHIDDFPELKDCLIVAEKSDTTNIKNRRISLEKILWSDENYWRRLTTGILTIYVIDQTCSRSTELKCHHRIYATHDFRNTIQYNTVAQAQQRVNHYIDMDRYTCFQPIHVYGSVSTFKLSAGLITIDDYLTPVLKKKKIDARTSPIEKYKILYTSDNRLHQSCSEEGMDECDADRILQEHGCFAEISISSRIDGSVREVSTYKGEWIPLTNETWDTEWKKYTTRLNITGWNRNPFIASADANHHKEGDLWLGYHRGWKHLDYKDGELYEIISGECKKITIAWGGNRLKICYQNGEVGVLVVRRTGVQQKNTLHTSDKSMYA
jgi:hypothetical protein